MGKRPKEKQTLEVRTNAEEMVTSESKKSKRSHKDESSKIIDTNISSNCVKPDHKKSKKRKHKESETSENMSPTKVVGNVVSDKDSIDVVATDDSNHGDNKKPKREKIKKKQEATTEDSPAHEQDGGQEQTTNETSQNVTHKKKKKDKKEKKSAADADKPSASALAVTYLHKWKKDRTNWNFQKVRQVWLLQNMYSAMVS